jgi:hypothetical protein
MAGGSRSVGASGVSGRGLIGKLMRLKWAAVNIRQSADHNRLEENACLWKQGAELSAEAA